MFTIPNIYNIPGLNLPGSQQNAGPKWSEVNPFRTVNDTRDGRGAGAYGQGLNASAAQLYDHFRQDGKWAANFGLPRAGMTQSIEDFLARGKPQPAQPAVPPPQAPTSGGGMAGNPGGMQGSWAVPQRFAGQPTMDTGMPKFGGNPFSFSPGANNPYGGGGGLPGMPSNPQVPQFNPSIFNMQPQTGGGMFGGARPQPGGTPRTRGVM